MAPKPDVSVLLVSFNQERFIAEAVAGVLDQVADRGVELVVADDASTDGTVGVITRMMADAPRLRLTVVPAPRNVGLIENMHRGVLACSGAYVAILEGDDKWISPSKLAEQAELLDLHPGSPACATNFFFVANLDDARERCRIPAGDAVTRHGPAALIHDNMPGNLSACMYRTPVLRGELDVLRAIPAGDWILNIRAARLGPLLMSAKPMSVYRQHPGGLWSRHTREEQNRMMLEIIPVYDENTGFAFTEEFQALARGLKGAAG